MSPQEPNRRSSRSLPGAAWIALVIVLLFVVAVRVRLLDFPLERDEGEYAYVGQLILQGVPPYTLAYTMKFPGTALMYAFFMALFGQTAQGIHLGLLMVNCASIALMFLIGRKMIGDLAAVAAAISYAVLSLNHSVFGFAAHATHFIVLSALGGTFALLHALDRDSLPLYAASGILFGSSLIMKQPGAFFMLFGLLYIIYHHLVAKPSPGGKPLIRGAVLFAVGTLLPLCMVLIWCVVTGVFDRFWFWTVTYAAEYGSMTSWPDALSRFMKRAAHVADGFTLLWYLAAAGLIAAFTDTERKEQRSFLLLFSVCAFLAFCPGFYFRPHYFITFLPAAALAVGYGVDRAWRAGSMRAATAYLRFSGIILVAFSMVLGFYSERAYFFEDSPAVLSRRIYQFNPFIESVEIARFIRSNSEESDTIAVFGSEPQIYFYANRHSATGHIYMYGMMEDHPYHLTMQKEMIGEVEAARPRFIVFTRIASSWFVTPTSNKFILTWLNGYLHKYYSVVGVADILSDDRTVYKWHDDARKYIFQSEWQMVVLERKPVTGSRKVSGKTRESDECRTSRYTPTVVVRRPPALLPAYAAFCLIYFSRAMPTFTKWTLISSSAKTFFKRSTSASCTTFS